jgi:RimJ/RimL family protein N-acetyltransferase
MDAGEGAQLRELRLRALRDAPAAFYATADGDAARPMRHWEDLARGPGTVLIAGDWAGMAGIFIEDGRAKVWGMWVAPEHRRSGAGRALLEAAVEWAQVRAFERLSLQVLEAAPDARAFYEAVGFQPEGDLDMVFALPAPERRIETERLLLRRFEPGDLDALHAMRSREDSVRWLYEDPPTLEQDRARLERRMGNLRFGLTGDALGFAATLPDGTLVGDLSLFLVSAEHHQGEIGFVVHPDHQGRGYATEAAGALLELAFGTFALHRVVGRLEARNAASARVLEKLGMRREAHLVENELVKGEWQSEVVYAALAQSQPRRLK